MAKPEIRKDYFLDKYVIIAANRAKRPHKVIKVKEDSGLCYFCPENIQKDEVITLEKLDTEGNWKILGLDNKFAALSLDNPRAYGKHELIIETPLHDTKIHELPIDHIVEIFDCYIERYEKLNSDKKIKYVLLFKNEGGKAGASKAHSHSQIMALPILPPAIKNEALAFAKYQLEKESCPYCDIIKDELHKKTRIIFEDNNLIALSPWASQSPYGVWFVPKRHIREITELNLNEKKSLAKALKKVLAKLDDIDVSYNYFIHNAINSEDYHMHLKLSPRPNIWAGLELGTGVIINSIPPEFAAKFYRGEIELIAEEGAEAQHLKIK
jgi:UDPglucose--hexose-1-phosphate uridylyltransferase